MNVSDYPVNSDFLSTVVNMTSAYVHSIETDEFILELTILFLHIPMFHLFITSKDAA